MINIENFIKRLEQILEYYNLSASAFADKVGVQRSGLSHLLSGRNKPSLDFVMRIVENYPEVDLYWLLNGKGNFPKNSASMSQNSSVASHLPEESNQKNYDLFSEKEASNEMISKMTTVPHNKNEVHNTGNNQETFNNIEQIVIFYTNGSFKIYKP